MTTSRARALLSPLVALLILCQLPTLARAEDDNDDTPYAQDNSSQPETTEKKPAPVIKRNLAQQPRKYFVPDTNRVDAGVFHTAFAVGGNFYIEPKIDSITRQAQGEYFKDFGFQGGIIFDYDYSQLPQNIPLALRGMVGYKYILSSVHVFTFDGVVRYMFRVSDQTNFGLGMGASAAVWYRAITDTSPEEEVLFLPSFILNAGFDFNPFMVDFKWLINRLGADSSIMGFELYFGIRL